MNQVSKGKKQGGRLLVRLLLVSQKKKGVILFWGRVPEASIPCSSHLSEKFAKAQPL
jgi:hypothetical protein